MCVVRGCVVGEWVGGCYNTSRHWWMKTCLFTIVSMDPYSQSACVCIFVITKLENRTGGFLFFSACVRITCTCNKCMVCERKKSFSVTCMADSQASYRREKNQQQKTMQFFWFVFCIAVRQVLISQVLRNSEKKRKKKSLVCTCCGLSPSPMKNKC